MNLVTGASGLLGSHMVEKLRGGDRPVRALVRRNSVRTWLESQKVEFVEGDLGQPKALRAACEGVDVVYHSAAKVGDWGRWEEYQRVTIDGTKNMIDAAIAAGVRRFVHVSSISVYGYHTRECTIDETEPLGFKLYKWAYYSRSKIEAEKVVWKAQREGKIEVTVIRPAWIYGERDRATVARLVGMIQQRKAKILGPGNNRLNVIYAGNIAEAAITAAHLPAANGEAYNCSNDGNITQQEYFDLLADAIGAPRVTRHVPYRVAYTAGFVLELLGHLFRFKNPPFITRYAVWLMGRRSFFSAEKARKHLNLQATVPYERGIPNTIRWYFAQKKQPAPPATPETARVPS